MNPPSPEDDNARPARRFTGMRARVLILILSLAGALLLAEFVVRAAVDAELDTKALLEQNRLLSIGNLIEPSDNPEQLYHLRQGIFEEWLGVLVATSPVARARISTIHPPPADPAIRIAMIGDSSSFGYRIFYEANYAETVRIALERAFAVPVELRNYSTPGYNSVQERSKLENVLAEWNPDLVILHYDHNDPNPQSAAPPGYIPPDYGDNFLGSKLIKFAMRKIRTHRNQGSRIFVGEDKVEESVLGNLRTSGPRYDAHLEELQRMGRLLEDAEIPAVAVIFEHGMERFVEPLKHPHYEDLHTSRLVPVLEEAGFHVLDLYTDYQALMRERDWTNLRAMWVSPSDSHPNAYGHAFIGENLQRFLLDTVPLKEALASAARRSAFSPVDTDRNEAAHLFQRSLVLIDLNRNEEAQEQLFKAITLAPESAALRMTLAQTHINRDQLSQAVDQLEKTTAIKPDYSSANMQLSRLYAYQKRYRDSLDRHDTARETARLPAFKQKISEGLAVILAKHAASAKPEDPALADALRSQAILLYRLADNEVQAADLLKGFDGFQPNPTFP